MDRACSTDKSEDKCILMGKPERKRPLGRPRRRWMGNIKMYLKKDTVWTGLIWLIIGISGGLL
jgi:hypothetical protein